MKGLIVLVDLFSLLAITLFVNFVLAVGSGGRNEEVERVTLVEMVSDLRADDGTTVPASGLLDYIAFLEVDGKRTDAGTVLQNETRGGHRFVIRGAPEGAQLQVLISEISSGAFSYEAQTVRLKRVYPGVESVSYEDRAIGAAVVYGIDLQ